MSRGENLTNPGRIFREHTLKVVDPETWAIEMVTLDAVLLRETEKKATFRTRSGAVLVYDYTDETLTPVK